MTSKAVEKIIARSHRPPPGMAFDVLLETIDDWLERIHRRGGDVPAEIDRIGAAWRRVLQDEKLAAEMCAVARRRFDVLIKQNGRTRG